MSQRRILKIMAILAASLLSLSSATVAEGQGSQTQGTKGSDSKDKRLSTLVGVVIDSINYLPMEGATILLDGTTITATTDKQGKFRIDSIPVGSYRIAVFHPLLDTLGYSIGTEPLRMGADSIREVIIGTPSAASVVLRACPASRRKFGPVAVMGRVVDPDSEIPLAGVRVSVVWTKTEVSKEAGFRRIPQMREATTDESGNYVICGVQNDISATIQAQRGDSETAEVPIDIPESQVLGFATLHLIDVPLSDSAPTTGEAVLSGRIINKTGAPIEGATVMVQGVPKSQVQTSADGSFKMTELPSGTRAVYARAIGHSPRQTVVNLTAAKPVTIEITLEDQPPSLASVEVEGKYEEVLKKNGFSDRRRMGMGRFLGPKDLERRNVQSVSGLFQTLPGFRVEQGFGGNSIKSTRGANGCVTFWVDGIQFREHTPGELDNQLMPEQLMAVETYSAVAAPAEYKTSGETDCSVVVIWTNRTVRR